MHQARVQIFMLLNNADGLFDVTWRGLSAAEEDDERVIRTYGKKTAERDHVNVSEKKNLDR